jgi:hypothetical protein
MVAVKPAALVRRPIDHDYDQDQTWETGSVATKTSGENDEDKQLPRGCKSSKYPTIHDTSDEDSKKKNIQTDTR